jgi:exodeoxyribonuclease III
VCSSSPQTNQKSAGFTPAERANFGALVSTHGFVDVFEHLYPDQIERWTYFGHRQNNRAKNKGWRLDYFVASSAEFVKNNVHDTWIGSELSQGDKGTRRSDHLPIFLCLKPAV